jgi:hypothetical protein
MFRKLLSQHWFCCRSGGCVIGPERLGLSPAWLAGPRTVPRRLSQLSPINLSMVNYNFAKLGQRGAVL